MKDLEALKYPIGRYKAPKADTPAILKEAIGTIKHFPKLLREELKRFSSKDHSKRYRPEGWTLKQLVHHCADSHLNSYVRFKWALTEKEPTIKAYDEKSWAELADGKEMGIDVSVTLLDALHQRWVFLLENLSEIELERTFYHPENKQIVTIKENILIYAWHCKHHLAHIAMIDSKK